MPEVQPRTELWVACTNPDCNWDTCIKTTCVECNSRLRLDAALHLDANERRIAELEAENERLRTALMPFAIAADNNHFPDDERYSDYAIDEKTWMGPRLRVSFFVQARAVLSAKKEEKGGET